MVYYTHIGKAIYAVRKEGEGMTGRIHSYETLGAADGPGLRFVLFLQGCGLRCLYCHNPDYMQIAAAYGIPSRRVMDRLELNDAIREMLKTDGPFLLETCVVEEGKVLPMTPPGSPVNYMLLDC